MCMIFRSIKLSGKILYSLIGILLSKISFILYNNQQNQCNSNSQKSWGQRERKGLRIDNFEKEQGAVIPNIKVTKNLQIIRP